MVVLPWGLEMVCHRQMMHRPAHSPHNNKRGFSFLGNAPACNGFFLAIPSACNGLNNSFLAILSRQWPTQEFLQSLSMQLSKQEFLRACDQELHLRPHGLLHHNMMVYSVIYMQRLVECLQASHNGHCSTAPDHLEVKNSSVCTAPLMGSTAKANAAQHRVLKRRLYLFRKSLLTPPCP